MFKQLKRINESLERLIEVIANATEQEIPQERDLPEYFPPGLYRATEESAKEYKKDKDYRNKIARWQGRLNWRD